MSGVIIYQGPSMINGAPIVAIATGLGFGSSNSNTGGMVQTWILRSDMSPTEAVNLGADDSICGDCIHRGTVENGKNTGRSCYVLVFQAPNNIYRTFKAGKYSVADNLPRTFANRLVRLGAYGDPAAVPVDIWAQVLRKASGNTGYTHQWRDFPALAEYCMASADTLAEAVEAQAMGFRTFRVTSDIADKQSNEFICPASEEKGKVITCAECMACGGNTSPNKASVAIQVHGAGGKVRNFKTATGDK